MCMCMDIVQTKYWNNIMKNINNLYLRVVRCHKELFSRCSPRAEHCILSPSILKKKKKPSTK